MITIEQIKKACLEAVSEPHTGGEIALALLTAITALEDIATCCDPTKNQQQGLEATKAWGHAATAGRQICAQLEGVVTVKPSF